MANEEHKTTREEIQDLMEHLDSPTSIEGIIQNFQSSARIENLIEDINHAIKSLKARGITFKIHPATCKKCNFVFKLEKNEIHIPSKCPKCKCELINAPLIQRK
nr:hypothetical protein [Candidatus Sigynarchaeota archaeon]